MTLAPLSVQVATVVATDLTEMFETGGIVQATTTAIVTARMLAPVRDVRVTAGTRVRAGQVLVVLDDRDVGAQARSARATVAGAGQGATAAAAEERAARAALVLTRATHDRIAALHAKRSATSQELDEATATLQGAEARVAAAAARVQSAASAIESAQGASDAAAATHSFTQIAAPFDGVITETMIEPGNMASPGLPLLRIEDTRAFRLDVRVDESQARNVTVGAVVPVRLDAGTIADATTLSGTISEIGRAIDSDARSFVVKISLPTTDGLRSGMFGRVGFAGATRRALTVPPDALVRRGQVTTVFVVDKGVARLRLVNVAGREVLAGLAEGETVVLTPAPDLIDGRAVREGGRQ